MTDEPGTAGAHDGQAPTNIGAAIAELGVMANYEAMAAGHDVAGALRLDALYLAWQFSPPSRYATVRVIVSILERELDGVSVLLWLVSPSHLLDQRRPIDLIDSDPVAVLDATRRLELVLSGR